MIITINGNSMKFDGPQPLSVIIRAMLPDTCEQVFACFVNGAVIELKSIVDKSAELVPITYRDEEGKRIYERSLRFVLLLAARELFPDYHVRIEHSIGQGVYLLLEGRRLYPGDVEALEGMMRDFIKRDLPFVRTRWSREAAIDYFLAQGDQDKANLLSYRPYNYFDIYTCGGMSEYFYGAMLPSTGMLKTFALRARAPDTDVVIEIIRTTGDKITDVPLAQIGGKGLFTKEIEEALLAGAIDLAVHSMKDLPTELPPGLCLGAVPKRENPRDVLVSSAGLTLDQLPPGALLESLR